VSGAASPVLQTIWCRSDPARVGAYLRPTEAEGTVGRDGADGHFPWLRDDRGVVTPFGPLTSSRVSRTQLVVRRDGDGIVVRNVGRRALLVRGEAVDQATAVPGDHVILEGEVAWRVVQRPAPHPAQRAFSLEAGHADAGGFVGDSRALWTMRIAVGRLVGRPAAQTVVGVSGPPGSRPSRVGRLLHHLMGRPGKARRFEASDPGLPQAATCLITRAQVGSALDRVGSRPDVQFVVVDARGDEGWPMVRLPGLAERREDIPSILRHHLLQLSLEEPTDMARLLDERGEVKVGLDLVEQLLGWPYERDVEELDQLVWRSVTTSPRSRLAAVGRARNVRTASWEDWGEVSFEDDEPVALDDDT